jgi:hypothetical protein
VTDIAKGTVWSTALLRMIGAPETPANYTFLNQWLLREHAPGDLTGAQYGNNPFFTTLGAGGSVGPIKAGSYPVVPASVSPGANKAGVALYPNEATGVWLTAFHIAAEYPAIAAALKSGTPASFQNNTSFQGELHAWSGGGYTDFQTIRAPAGPVGATIEENISTHSVPKGAHFSWSSSSGIGGALAGAGSAAAGAVGAGAQHIPGVKQAEGIVSGAEATASFLGKLTDPAYILRGLEILAGGVLLLVGLFLLARQVALAADVPDPINAFGGAAVKALK